MPRTKKTLPKAATPEPTLSVFISPDDIVGLVVVDGTIRAVYRKAGRLHSEPISRIWLKQG